MEARGEAAKRRLLRILVADERREALDSLRRLLEELGHEVLAQAVSVAEVGEVIASEGPDISLVRLHEDDAHALALIAEIARGGPAARCWRCSTPRIRTSSRARRARAPSR